MEVLIIDVDQEQALSVHLLDPAAGLSLRVDVEGPSLALCDAHTILARELIDGESLALPILNLSLVSKELGELVVLIVRQLQLGNLLHPHLAKCLAVVGRERPTETDKSGSQGRISDQVLDLLVVLEECVLPTLFLVSKASNEFVSTLDLGLQLGQVCLELVHLVGGLLQLSRELLKLGLKLSVLILHGLELVLEDLKGILSRNLLGDLRLNDL